MALNFILRRALPPLVPRFHHAIIPAGKHNFSKYLAPAFLLRSYSFAAPLINNADANLLQVVGSEIKSAEEDLKNRVAEIQEDFPFEIKDFPGAGTLTLIRKFENETIKLELDMPDIEHQVNNDESGDEEDDNNEAGENEVFNNESAGESSTVEEEENSSIPVSVTISKEDNVLLEFNVTACPDEITIDSFTIREPDSPEDLLVYGGRRFQDLDLNLQKALHEYLEIRGIKPSTTNFLHEYMINKDIREHLLWLNKLKTYLEK